MFDSVKRKTKAECHSGNVRVFSTTSFTNEKSIKEDDWQNEVARHVMAGLGS